MGDGRARGHPAGRRPDRRAAAAGPHRGAPSVARRRAPGRPGRRRRAGPGRGAGRGRAARAADAGEHRAPAPTRGRPGAARTRGRQPRRERGAAQRRRRAGWRSAPGLRRAGRRAARQLQRPGDRSGDRVAELFEPFRRGPVDRTADTPGSGLGLSIVRAVVHAHGGHGGGRTGAGRRPHGDRAPPGTRWPRHEPETRGVDGRSRPSTPVGPSAVTGASPAVRGRLVRERRGSGDRAGQVREQRGEQVDLPLAGAARAQRAGDVAVGGRGPAEAAQEVGLQQVLHRDRPLLATAPRCRRGRRRAGRRRPGRGRPSGRRAGGPSAGGVGARAARRGRGARPAPAPRTSRR